MRVRGREGVDEIRVNVLTIIQGRRQRDLLREQRITQLQRQILAQRNAELETAAERFRAVREKGVGERLPGKQVDAPRHALVEKIGLDEAQFRGANELPIGDRGLSVAAGAEQVVLGDRSLRHPAVRGRKAAHDRELAGRLLLDEDVDHHPVGRRARLVGDLHRS